MIRKSAVATAASLLVLSLAASCPSTEASIVYTDSPFSSTDANGLSPYWDWKTLESDHFRITYPAELHDVAEKSANDFEEAHRLLSPLFRWTPHHKTQVLVIDNLDSGNGLTSPAARFGIILWATPPDYWYGSGYYDDWLRLLIIHEYTHFLNMDTTHGLWDSLRYVFGDSLLPNSIWPAWMLEGLAVYMETQFTQGGRGRSPYYEMVLRAAHEEGLLDSPDFVTLDKINGTNPTFPGGDTKYLFGYQLMNQIAKSSPNGFGVLGEMSERSSARVPFFINGNLENLTGKDWKDYWNLWLIETRSRLSKDLEKIKSQPLSQMTFLTEKNHELSTDVIGVTASPDGEWLAYTLSSTAKRQGLYLRNRKTGKTSWLLDKSLGIGLSFTPDSKTLIYSRLIQHGQYERFSDLEVYDLTSQSVYSLTDQRRLRDPQISRDGKWVTFTLSEKSMTGLAIAPLIKEGDRYHLGPIEKLFMPGALNRVGNPQFSIDGKKIYFSLHENGKTQEDILLYNRETHSQERVISNGRFNRFPVMNEKGELYFVSDLTGTDNLYRFENPHQPPTLVTNVTTGVRYPAFGPAEDSKAPLYMGVLTYSGWNLAQIQLLDQPIAPETITLSRPPAPEKQNSSTSQIPIEYPEKDYSVFPSLLPRVWSPLLGVEGKGIAFGGEVFGFDATNVHRYLIGGSYNTNFQIADVGVVYSNRTLGPAIDLQASLLTNYVRSTSNASLYGRDANLSAKASYPLLWTYSSLTPSLGMSFEKYYYYETGSNATQVTRSAMTPIVPSLDVSLTYSDLETSPLALGPETGRVSFLGLRSYLRGEETSWKALAYDQENFRISRHTILSPSLRGLWVSRSISNFPASSAYLQGRSLQTLVNPFPGNTFNLLEIRGYPNILSAPSRFTTVAALDLRFPIARIFRGIDTNPFFADNLWGTAFAEMSYVPYLGSGYFLPSTGASIRLSTEIFFIPLTFALEFHQGWRQDLGGSSDLFLQIISRSISF